MIRRSVHRLAAIAIWSLIGLFGGLLLAVTVPYVFGSRNLTVLSGSMEPTCTWETSWWCSRCCRWMSVWATS